jgi:Kef-type K+ transport system membrane component KefB
MNSQDFVKFGLQISVMLGCAVFFGQLMRRIRQPAVLGEMVGGILLGPTLLGFLLPALYFWLFQSSPNVTIVRDASIKLGMLFFLFIAGLEINLSDLRRLGKRAILIGLIGTVLPILFGVGLVYAIPHGFWGPSVQAHFLSFALFIGMNLANSANPVIARVLMDLGLMKGQLGTLIMTATIVDDLINWSLFAIILSDIAPVSGAGSGSLLTTLALIILFFVIILGVGRAVGSRALHWVRYHLSWPMGFIAISALMVLIAGSISEGLGVHAFLGAFLVGAALGGNGQEKNEAHDVISNFVLSFFAPIYFVSMGMTTNFITNFNLSMVVIIMVAAFISKIGAVLLGARVAGMRLDREAWAIGFGLNARGATGIILAGVGLANHVIDDRIYVAIVIMAIVTSLVSGPAMNVLLKNRKTVPIQAGSIPN